MLCPCSRSTSSLLANELCIPAISLFKSPMSSCCPTLPSNNILPQPINNSSLLGFRRIHVNHDLVARDFRELRLRQFAHRGSELHLACAGVHIATLRGTGDQLTALVEERHLICDVELLARLVLDGWIGE